MKKLILSAVFFLGVISVTAQQSERPNQEPGGNKPPSAKQVIKDMDTNKDGKISKDEAKGPLKDDFSKIDTNKDGFISLEELKKAPKPERKRPT